MAQLIGEVQAARPKSAARGLHRSMAFWLIALARCLLPLEWWLLPFSLKPSDFGLILLVAYGCLLLLIYRQRVILPLWAPFWLILFASVLATLTGAMHADSLMAILQETYLYVWFVVLVNLLARFPSELFHALLKLWSVIALLEAVATLLGMLHIGPAMFYTNPNGNIIEAGGDLDRAVGTFANANAAGAYLFISLFVLLAARWPRWFKIVGACWLLAGMFATGSMG
ncbi:MAG TPA: hypothetical protein VHO48_15845, partial [Anaerolineaceae bacterium]|nr:hypothetical protein [Anaerolineaceae bacterium]